MRHDRGLISLPLLLILTFLAFYLHSTKNLLLSHIHLRQREHALTNTKLSLLDSLLRESKEETVFLQQKTKKGVQLSATSSFVTPSEKRPLFQLNHFFLTPEMCVGSQFVSTSQNTSLFLTGFQATTTCKVSELAITEYFRTRKNLNIGTVGTEGKTSSYLISSGTITIENLVATQSALAIVAGGNIHIKRIHATSKGLAFLSLSGSILIDQVPNKQKLYSSAPIEKSIPPHIALSSTTLLSKSEGWVTGVRFGE